MSFDHEEGWQLDMIRLGYSIDEYRLSYKIGASVESDDERIFTRRGRFWKGDTMKLDKTISRLPIVSGNVESTRFA